MNSHRITGWTAGGVLVALGIVFGDIGTSPLYVLKAILGGSVGGLKEEFVLGGISAIFWTLTLITTIKYVVLVLRADNNGEGGTFALYALLRKRNNWIYVLAIVGGSALIADGVITPAITVVSAIEGLKNVSSSIPIIPIVLAIITVMFAFQRFGTNLLGKSFGPVMLFWFLMLGVLGLVQIAHYPAVLKAFSPHYAVMLLAKNPGGFALLGSIFLCTTGAEALYADLGHCGKRNIQISWFFVKLMLLLNYFGQGAWVISHLGSIGAETNPFYAIMPSWFLYIGITTATLAAIIASQALITGCFTIFSEAIQLNFWPKLAIKYPSDIKSQVYVPFVNQFLFIACMVVVLAFQTSTAMEAMYGLAITLGMLTTTLMMLFWLEKEGYNKTFSRIFVLSFAFIELMFFLANMVKFMHGGWFTLMLGCSVAFVMFVWYNARKIKNRFIVFENINNSKEVITDIIDDETIPKYATHLFYLTKANERDQIEQKVLYSIINKSPKRADTYWFLHLNITEHPDTFEYAVNELEPGKIFRVDFNVGFKISTSINSFLRNVIEDLIAENHFDIISRYPSLRKHRKAGDFRFVIIDTIVNHDIELPRKESFIMKWYSVFRMMGINDLKAYHLDTSSVLVEKVPLSVRQSPNKRRMERVVI